MVVDARVDRHDLLGCHGANRLSLASGFASFRDVGHDVVASRPLLLTV